MADMRTTLDECRVEIKVGKVTLEGSLCIPNESQSIVLFAHGSGSSRMSPRNRYVARELRQGGLGTLLFDLLTRNEESIDEYTAQLRFDIRLLADRLAGATDWLKEALSPEKLRIGYFGASTGAAAALVAAAERQGDVGAIVSRGGRPDLAGGALSNVKAPTLLIVGGNDEQVIELNRDAMQYMKAERKLEIVARATHLFEEPGALEQVSQLAKEWFVKYLVK